MGSILEPRVVASWNHPVLWRFARPNIHNRIIEDIGAGPWFTLTAVHRGTHKILEENPVTIRLFLPSQTEYVNLRECGLSSMYRQKFSKRVVYSPYRTLMRSYWMQVPLLFRWEVAWAQDSYGIGVQQWGGIILSKNNLHIHIGVTNFHALWSQDTPKSK